MRAARAGESISRSWLWPSIDLRANGIDWHTNFGSSVKGVTPDVPDIRAAAGGIDVSWEIDIFGRLRTGAAAAAADTVAAEYGARGVRLLVLTDVAANYFTILELNGDHVGTARFLNAAALMTMPVFNAGRTQALNDIAESGQKEAVIRYEDAIVRALEDVENALVALRDERQRAQDLQSAATAADAALGRAQSLYDRGQTDLLPLLDAQRARLAVRVSLNESNTRLLLDSVQLYKALGGGWQVFEPSAGPAASGATQSPNSRNTADRREEPP